MANYTAADIKALREQTGAGMMDVKKALDEADGDQQKALEIIRVKGLKGVAKREGRSASDGLVAVEIVQDGDRETGVMVELNSETDFVAKNQVFITLAEKVLAAAVASGAEDVEALLAAPTGHTTLGALVDQHAATAGEQLVVRRVARPSRETVTSHLHRSADDLAPRAVASAAQAGAARLAAPTGDPTVGALVAEHAATLGEKLVVRRVARLSGEKVTSYLHRTAEDLPPQVGVLVATDAAGAEVAKDVAMHIAAFSPQYLTRDDVPQDVVANERRIAE